MFYEGLGTTPDNWMGGTMALQEPYALSRAGFCDRLLQRLLEGDGPVASLFEHNPFAGTRPTLVRMRTVLLEPAPLSSSDWWVETHLGLNRPPTAARPELWEHYCAEPELLHWDGLFFRQKCAGHLGCVDSSGDGLPDPASVTFRRPHLRYDGATLTRTEVALTAKDVREFWAFLDAFPIAERRDWRTMPAAARLAREMMGMAQLARLEMVLSRMAMQLAASRTAPAATLDRR